MQTQQPYVSFVIAGRNDDYGGDFNDRLSNSVNQLSYLLEKYQVPSEYIVVNYNPIAEKKSLFDAINWRQHRKYLRIRIIDVSPEVHRANENPQLRKPLPFYEYVAKNAGIRRAKGEYICAANPDIIFDPGIVEFLATQKLNKAHFYRTDRCDFIKPQSPPPADPKDFIQWLNPAIFRVFLKGNHYDYKVSTKLALPFLRFYNNNLLKLDLLFAKYPKLGNAFRWKINFHNAEYHFHCNVSGDFMMMHRDKWIAFHGFPESTNIALHTDALFVVVAGTSGLKETVLQHPICHQDHGRRYDAQKDEFDPLLRTAYLYFQNEAQVMIREKHHKIYNPATWGLAGYQLKEVEF
ncbi:MAG: hypothetical protein SH857_03030 [Chitinophagales bacterium]|nr:hypothetical protein [Chitinophagales bacterium]